MMGALVLVSPATAWGQKAKAAGQGPSAPTEPGTSGASGELAAAAPPTAPTPTPSEAPPVAGESAAAAGGTAAPGLSPASAPVAPAPAPSCDCGVEEQGLSATMVAQGVGDFLTERAEQEVSAFATVELFARLCSAEGAKIMPKTCDLLEGQDEGANPVGLGLLKRTVERDLREVPGHLLRSVYDRVKDHAGEQAPAARRRLASTTRALCAVDLGVAITQALRARIKVEEIVTSPASAGLALLKQYSALSSVQECARTWTKLEKAIDTSAAPLNGAATELYLAIQQLYTAKTASQVKEARSTVASDAVELAKVMLEQTGDVERGKHETLLDELAEVATATWNHDWVGVVSAATSADELGPLLLCKDPEQDCRKDEKVRLLLSIGADIADAKSSGDVQAALNRLAEPIGSWRRKFQDTWTFTLQGYAGGSLAYEVVQGNAPSSLAAAPVLALGLEWSVSLGVARLGVFGKVIDVGSVASVRFAEKDDASLTEVEVTPDITWAQLFGPGGYLVFAPFKAPFVLGAGVDYVPALRRTLAGPRSAWHFGGFLAVDVPVMELAHQ